MSELHGRMIINNLREAASNEQAIRSLVESKKLATSWKKSSDVRLWSARAKCVNTRRCSKSKLSRRLKIQVHWKNRRLRRPELEANWIPAITTSPYTATICSRRNSLRTDEIVSRIYHSRTNCRRWKLGIRQSKRIEVKSRAKEMRQARKLVRVKSEK